MGLKRDWLRGEVPRSGGRAAEVALRAGEPLNVSPFAVAPLWAVEDNDGSSTDLGKRIRRTSPNPSGCVEVED